MDQVRGLQVKAILIEFLIGRLMIIENEALNGSRKLAYSLDELMSDLKNGILVN